MYNHILTIDNILSLKTVTNVLIFIKNSKDITTCGFDDEEEKLFREQSNNVDNRIQMYRAVRGHRRRNPNTAGKKITLVAILLFIR